MIKYKITTDGNSFAVRRKWHWFIFWGWTREHAEYNTSYGTWQFHSEATAEEYAKDQFGKDRKRVRKWRVL